ncbi:hypothetical protein HaLaN_11521 [Haematococcus lacustris]|uniref:Uncharacterized protein n=1 Tax=Haematococcus lacustris TaxID=44745 RepID=A0A699YYE4_HAELA|nr:hypothetical protein HaLaN_11521 [Haematococcus lacustris]
MYCNYIDAQRQYDLAPRPKQDLEQLVSAVKELPFLTSSSQAVQLLPEKLAWGAPSQAISMTFWAMAKSGYTGSAQPLLQSVTAAISQAQRQYDLAPRPKQDLEQLVSAVKELPFLTSSSQ